MLSIVHILCVYVVLCSVGTNHEGQLPPGHTTPPAGQAVGSKCPFLAAEMVQRNSSNKVVREAGMELQEDVTQMHIVHAGKILLSLICNWIPVSLLCKIIKCRCFEHAHSLKTFKRQSKLMPHIDLLLNRQNGEGFLSQGFCRDRWGQHRDT